MISNSPTTTNLIAYRAMHAIRVGWPVLLCLTLLTAIASACPPDQARDSFGICWPTAGGAVADTFEHVKRETAKIAEKAKREVTNMSNDIKVLVETGKCGGDVCDAVNAYVKFIVDDAKDIGPILSKAGERMREGKPIDAIWHIGTDSLKSKNDNAANAVYRSTLLAAMAQVAASAYGGPGGAAAYSAWLTYNMTKGDVAAALKAGIISGATAYGMSEIQMMELNTETQIARVAILNAAINGVAVAASGGTQAEIQNAATMGLTTVLVRAGYRKLSSFNLDDKRLRSSQGPAYCKAAIPAPAYFRGGYGGSDCLPPPSAYKTDAQGRALTWRENSKTWEVATKDSPPFIDQSKLDPNRAQVGLWADDSPPKWNHLASERGPFMTGVSKLPLTNAMAVGHDALSAKYFDHNLTVDLIPTVATIPPSITLTYIGSGQYIHEMIREGIVRSTESDRPASIATAQKSANGEGPKGLRAPTSPTSASPVEVVHVICGKPVAGESSMTVRTELLIEATAPGSYLRSSTSRKCEVTQRVENGVYRLWHAHNDLDSCFKKASQISMGYQRRDFTCVGSQGIRMQLANARGN